MPEIIVDDCMERNMTTHKFGKDVILSRGPFDL